AKSERLGSGISLGDRSNGHPRTCPQQGQGASKEKHGGYAHGHRNSRGKSKRPDGIENACYRDKSSHPRIFAKLHRLHQHEHCPCRNHKVQVALQVVGKCHIMPVSNVAMATYFTRVVSITSSSLELGC